MEDSTTNQEINPDDDATEDAHVQTGLWLSGRHDAQLPISVVGGLVGMLAGTLPAAIWVLIFKVSFSPLYVCLPLFIYLGLKVFKGYSGKRGFIVTCIFSAIGFYLTILSCQAALDVLKYKMLFTNLPLVTITLIGKNEAFSGPVFSSAYVFPLLFVILGALLSFELLMKRHEPAALQEPESVPDPE